MYIGQLYNACGVFTSNIYMGITEHPVGIVIAIWYPRGTQKSKLLITLPFPSVVQGWSRLETSLDNLNSSETWIARHWLHRDKRGSNRSWKSTAESWKSRNVNTRLSIEKVSPPRPNSPESQTIKNENSQKKPSNLKDVWYWWEGNMRVVRSCSTNSNYTGRKSNWQYVSRLSFLTKNAAQIQLLHRCEIKPKICLKTILRI